MPGSKKRESMHWSSVPDPKPQSPTRSTGDSPTPKPYRVQLDAYAGPLDLLLHLVKQHEIDLHDIPIATLTSQYLAHLDQMARGERAAERGDDDARTDGVDDVTVTLDVDRAGEFLVMAATLVEIKSATLMPRINADEADADAAEAEAQGDAADPRFELVRQLLAYKKFKDAASMLEERRDAWADRFPAGARTPKPAATGPEDEAGDSSPAVELDLEDLGVNDLCDAFGRLLDSIGFVGDHKVTYDETPISLHAEDIADRLERDGASEGDDPSSRGMSLRELFVGRRSRSEMIGLFLATLELVRQRRVRVTQPDAGGDIRLVLRPEADRNDLDGSDGAAGLAPAAESAPKDLTVEDVAGFDWPDEATRRRVERRIRLRAAHRDTSESDLEGVADHPNPFPAEADSVAQSDAEPADDQADGGPGAQPVPLPDAHRADPGSEASGRPARPGSV